MKLIRKLFVGFLITLGVLTLLVAIMSTVGVSWYLSKQEQRASLPSNIVLELDLREEFPLNVIGGPADFLADSQPMSLDDLVLALDAATRDDRVKGIFLRLAETAHGLAKAQEIRDSLVRFRESGRFAVGWADTFGELTPGNEGYLIATALDSIALQPGGFVGINGISIEVPFFRELLGRIGVEMTVFRRSDYKTAMDSFAQDGLTDAHAQTLEDLADSIYGQLLNGIAEGRGLDSDTVEQLIDRAPINAEDARAAGLVDALEYHEPASKAALEKAGTDASFVPLAAYSADTTGRNDGESEPARIALIGAEGAVVRGSDDFSQSIAADTLSAHIRDARGGSYDGVILRIDTGGGSAIASETIAHELRELVASGTPVVVSMVNAAASGGYWIAVEGSHILAQPGTFTGSIGVIAGKPIVTEALDKLGVSVAGTQRGDLARMWSFTSELSPAEAERIDMAVGHMYEAFKQRVGDGRELSFEEVEAIAQGRVWLGDTALELGLIDGMGGLLDAREEMRQLLDLNDSQALTLVRLPSDDWKQQLLRLLAIPEFFAHVTADLRSAIRAQGTVEVENALPRLQ